MHWTVKLLLIVSIVAPAILHGAELERDALFHIERNKNANIIQYDAQVKPDGMLDSREPVVGYWIRLAEQGQVKELIWIEKKFAYGFTTKLNKGENTATLDMAADIGRTILVKRDGEGVRNVFAFIELISSTPRATDGHRSTAPPTHASVGAERAVSSTVSK